MGVGLSHDVTIDGVDYDYAPDVTSIDIENNERIVPTNGDTFLIRDQVLAGLPDVEERFPAIPFPSSGTDTDAERRRLQLLRVTGGFHTMALWVPERAIYTAIAGQTAFYLGRRRRDAGVVHGRSGLFPMTATLNGVALTVSVVAGSAPSVPVAGILNVATDAVTSGEYLDYTKFTLAACTAGDVVEVTYYPLLRVYASRTHVSYTGTNESHDLVFVER